MQNVCSRSDKILESSENRACADMELCVSTPPDVRRLHRQRQADQPAGGLKDRTHHGPVAALRQLKEAGENCQRSCVMCQCPQDRKNIGLGAIS